MPKCLNDNKKSFKGTENSPLGLGYCSSNENIGTIMIGKNNKEWIVKQTKTSKRWTEIKSKNTRNNVMVDDSSEDELINNIKKIDLNMGNIYSNINLNELDSSFYTDVYFPIISKLEIKETGLESKFGGSVPFFIEGEEWPISCGSQMNFICQLIDPLQNNNILYRVFFCSEELTIYLTTIEMNEINKKKQIILKDNDNKSLEAYLINNWEQKKELISYENILKKLNIEDNDNEDIYNKFSDSIYFPSFGTKIKGTPQFTQSIPKFADKFNFFQLSESKFLNFEFGDSGIIHVNRNGDTYFDCY